MKTKKRIPSAGPRPWSGEKIYFKGDDYFKDVLKAIDGAKRSVDFEVYIYEKGSLGDRVTAALVQAARRGVKVRLLVDGVGSPDGSAVYGEKLKRGGVRFKVYHRLPSFFTFSSRFFGSLFELKLTRHLRNFWSRLNRRDHRKLVMVDGTKVWMGGFNVSDQHLESAAGKKAWRDTGIGLSGVKDKTFGLAFDMTWNEKGHLLPWRIDRRRLIDWLSRKSSSQLVQINATRRLRRRFHRELLEHLRSARRRIWVTTPYFVPALPVMRALLHAGLEGRDVRLVLPQESDVPFVRWASMTFFSPLLKASCRIFEYRKSILHAKTLMVDDWALVGSSNFNHRSFLFDLEVDVVVQKPASRRALERQYALDFKESREIFPADLRLRPLWARWLTWLFFRFRHWL